jgi:hypothetical protein
MNNHYVHELKTKLDAELDALTALGSPDDVAAKLESEGVIGSCGSMQTCPLAQYVAKKLDCDYKKGAFVCVNGLDCAVARITYVKSSLSNTLKQFVKNVDLGKYPKIVHPHSINPYPTGMCYTWA